MSWFTVLKGLLGLANYVAKYMADKQLLDAGQYKEIARNNEKALKNIAAAQRARDSISPDDSLHDDPNNRDRGDM